MDKNKKYFKALKLTCINKKLLSLALSFIGALFIMLLGSFMTTGMAAAASYTWGNPTEIDLSTPQSFKQISCPSSTFCMAIDSVGNYLIYNGSSWSAASPISGLSDLNSVFCTDSSFCIVVDNSGNQIGQIALNNPVMMD